MGENEKQYTEEEIKELSKIYSVYNEENMDLFEEYKKTALVALTTGKKTSKDKTLIIVGGQSGAGKSRLIPVANQSLEKNAVIVDFDELRSLHPNYKEVSSKYTEITHRILHSDTEKVKNEVLKELIKSEYSVIYEGALRSTQGFIDFAKDFRDAEYNIKMYIMAVPKLESYGSTFLRYAMDHLTNSTPRWVEKYAHDGSYEGVTRTVKTFIDEKMVDNIDVFVRDTDAPRRIYSSKEELTNALDAIEQGRELGRKQAIIDFQTKFDTVRNILATREPGLIEKLDDWKELYEMEVKYFKSLEDKTEERG